MSATAQLIRMRIEADLDDSFSELDQNVILKDILEILVWRELRLKDFIDFIIILEEKGGVEVFADYDFKMKKSA